MAFQGMTGIQNMMRDRVRGCANEHYLAMQTRYGDPRVYQQQEEQMRKDRAAVEYAKSKKTSELLEDAYKRQQERNRETHYKRVSTRNARKLTLPPQSQAAAPELQTPRPDHASASFSDRPPTSGTRRGPP